MSESQEPQSEDVEIQEVSAKNSKLEAIEFLRELAGYPQIEYSVIAKRVGIPQSTARDYVKRYYWAVLNTMHDSDYPRRLLELYNHDTVAVPPDKALTHVDINHLNPIVNKYAKFTTEHPESRKEIDQPLNPQPQTKRQSGRMVSRPPREEEEEGDEDFEEEEDEFSPKRLMGDVAGSTNAQYLYMVMKDIPGIGNPKIRHYLRLFTKNEARYMADPEIFRKELKVFFGDGPGELIYNSFAYGMSTFGRPGQGIGMNPYTGQPYGGSSGSQNDWIKNNPNLESYYKMGIIPYGVPPDSHIAIQAVNKFHERQARKEQMEEEDMNFGRWLKARTAKAMEENIGGGQNNNNMMNMGNLVAAGLVEMQVGVDETGKQIMKYIPKRKEGGGGLFGGGDNGGGNGQIGLLQTIISGKDQLINTLIAKSMEQPKMMESLLGRFIQNIDPDPTAQFARMKQMAETFNQGNNSVMNSIEAMRLRLEETRLNKDMTMADNESKRMFEKERWEKERQERMDIEAGKNTQHIMDGIIGLGKEMLGPAVAILSGKGLGGLIPGMPGAPGGMGGGMPGAGGMQNPFAPQQQQANPFAARPQPQQNRMSPETYAYMQQVDEAKRRGGAGPYPGARPQTGFRPFQESPPRPMGMGQGGQDVIEEYDEAPQHVHTHVQQQPMARQVTADQFANAAPEQLDNVEREALRRRAELDNYINTVRKAKMKKTNVFKTRRPQNVMEEEMMVAPTTNGGIDTTVSPPQDVAIVHPKAETGSVDIPDMVPEKMQKDNVQVPGQAEDESEDEEDEEEEYEEGEDEGEDEVEEAT